MKYLCAHYTDPAIAAQWPDALQALCRGEHPHAATMMALLLQERLTPKPPAPPKEDMDAVLRDVYDIPDHVACSYGGWAYSLNRII